MNLYRSLILLGAPLWIAAVGASQRPNMSPTEALLAAIEVQEGGTVCEIGAGDGEMSIAAARMVGPSGRVYSSELGEPRIRKLREKVAASGLAQITVVAGHRSQTNFPDAQCDGVFMHDVYHHLTDPAAMNRSIAAAVKPGGRVAVLDFTPPGQEGANPADRAGDGKHGVLPETVVREMNEASLETVSIERRDRRQFMVVLSKPRTTGGSVQPDRSSFRASPALEHAKQIPVAGPQ